MSATTVMQLIRELRSPDNESVLKAVEELRERGQLTNGALIYASLWHVHLQGANLHGADLRKASVCRANLQDADLTQAHLQGAKLRGANLYGADLAGADLLDADLHQANLNRCQNLVDSQLTRVQRLQAATMPDGSRYDGCFNLPGDITFARMGGRNTGDARSMAEFYGVSVDEYKSGQRRMREDIPDGLVDRTNRPFSVIRPIGRAAGNRPKVA